MWIMIDTGKRNRLKLEAQKWDLYYKIFSTANYASALLFTLIPESQATADTIVYVSTFIFDGVWDLFYFSSRHFFSGNILWIEICDVLGEKGCKEI